MEGEPGPVQTEHVQAQFTLDAGEDDQVLPSSNASITPEVPSTGAEQQVQGESITEDQAKQQPTLFSSASKRFGGTLNGLMSSAKAKVEQVQTGSIVQSLQAGMQSLQSGIQQRIRRRSDPEGACGGGSGGGAAADAAATDVEASVAQQTASELPSGANAASSAAALASLYAAAADLGKKTREGGINAYQSAKESGIHAYQSAVQGLKRLTAPKRRIMAICKRDLKVTPCPQLILACCTVVATKGLTSYGIFRSDAPQERVDMLLAQFEGGLLLVPSDLDPSVAATAIKCFLGDLDEPLLTTKLVDRWVASTTELEGLPELLEALPAANLTVLRVLLETCYRVAEKFNLTGMNALSLAEQLAPVLLWRVPERQVAGSAAIGGVVSNLPNLTAIQAIRAKLGGKQQQEEAEAAAVAAAEPPLPNSEPAAQPEAAAAAETAVVAAEERHSDDHDEDEDAEGEEGEERPRPAKVPLIGSERDALVAVITHLILNFEDLLVPRV